MKHKILGIAVLLCAVFLAACSDLVDELTPKETYYRMEIPSDIENGKVSADKTSARAGDTVRLTLSADEGYKLNGQPTVKDADGANVPVREITPGEVYEFTMPKSAVKVSAVFSPIPTSVTVTISESTGDFSLESAADGTKLTFTAGGTDSGANLVWKVYKGDEALTGSDYTQSSTDASFSFDISTLESGNYTLLVTSGTRSAAAVFTVNNTVTYTVKHLFEKVDGSGYEQNTSDYPDETEAGTAGDQTEASAKTVTGFTAIFSQETIAADGSTVVEIKYDRVSHIVTYEDGADDDDIAVPEDGTFYRYGQAVTVIFTGIGTRPGYLFTGWKQGDATYTSDGDTSFTMGDSPVTLTAQWTKIGTTFAVTISESTGDFSLESEADGTKLTFTAVGTDSGANLVWKVYKGDEALTGSDYTQSSTDASFSFDTSTLESGNYTLFVTSGTRSATAVFTVNTTVTYTVTLKTGSAINSILVSLCKSEYGYPACTKFARSNTNSDEATLYLDTEEKYIPVWLVGTEVYYYVPDGCTPVMNEDSSGMFVDCDELTSLEVTGFDTSKVTNMSRMFCGCFNLTGLDVSKFVTSNVTNMSGMFNYCSNLTELDVSKFDTSNVTDMASMFDQCFDLASLDVTGFNTSNVTNMSRMFAFCPGLKSLDVTGFDTSKVSNMWDMFFGCSGLTGLDVSKFVTSKVENMSGMFGSCSGLNSLDVSKFDTSSVTTMEDMFYKCSGLTSLDVTGFDTSKVTSMSEMFAGCSGLKSLDVSKFVTSKVTNMSKMFDNCSGLTSLDLSNFDTSAVTNMHGMFGGCSALETIYATNQFVTTNVESDYGSDFCFDNCTSLKGGAGTTYDESKTSVTYARIDGGTDAPGYFTLKPIGSKSKPDAVGDIVFSDGSATPYTADLTLTDEEKTAAIAVIFYAGSASDTLGAKTLGVGLVQGENLAWAQTDTNGYTNKITTLLATKTSGSNADDATFSGNGANDGSGSLAKLKGAVSDYSEANYPAWAWIEGYAATANLTGTSYESLWYIPSIGEVCALHKAKAVVNNSIQKIGGTQISAKWYWSSSQDASADINAWDVPLGSVGGFNSGFLGQGWKSDMVSVCAVRAFN